MSNKPESFVDYYKIKWARRSGWSLEQAAYLSCGENPDEKKYELSAKAENAVSHRYFWLKNKRITKPLNVIDVIDDTEYFNKGSLFRALAEKFSIEKDMQKVFDHMYEAPFGIEHYKFISRSVYREAGRLIFQEYPHARIEDVAKSLEGLPKHFNNDQHGHIETLGWVTIATYLKNLSQLNQKPALQQIPKVEVDLAQLVESL